MSEPVSGKVTVGEHAGASRPSEGTVQKERRAALPKLLPGAAGGGSWELPWLLGRNFTMVLSGGFLQ